MSQDEHFDSEILSYFEPLQKLVKELQAKVAALESELAAHEKRELLRVRGNQNCRKCNSQERTINPPMSDAEQTFHEGNHATGAVANPSMRMSGYQPTVNWDDLVAYAAALRKARGG